VGWDKFEVSGGSAKATGRVEIGFGQWTALRDVSSKYVSRKINAVYLGHPLDERFRSRSRENRFSCEFQQQISNWRKSWKDLERELWSSTEIWTFSMKIFRGAVNKHIRCLRNAVNYTEQFGTLCFY
jgi:hypothetical protein